MKVCTEAGFVNEGPIYSRQTNVKRVGQLSSLRTEDGRDRLLLANDLRYSDTNHITHVHARVTSIIHEKVLDEQGCVSLRFLLPLEVVLVVQFSVVVTTHPDPQPRLNYAMRGA